MKVYRVKPEVLLQMGFQDIDSLRIYVSNSEITVNQGLAFSPDAARYLYNALCENNALIEDECSRVSNILKHYD